MSHICIKSRKKIYRCACIFAVVGLFSLAAYFTLGNILSVNAEGENTFGYEEEDSDLTIDYNFTFDLGNDDANERIIEAVTEDIGDLPTEYDSRNVIDPETGEMVSYVSRQENQGSESLCWAYSFTTAIESSILRSKLRKSGESEVSVKQLDYLLSKNGFNDSSNNTYYNKLSDLTGLNRSLTKTGNFTRASVISTGKHSLVDESDFSGEQISQNERIEYSEISNLKGDYIPTDYELTTGFMYYGENDKLKEGENGASLPIYNRDLVIKHIKKAIMDHGTVAVTTVFNKDNCGYYDGNGNYTYIDRTARNNKNVCQGFGHAITLVGWDDDWDYGDPNKNGAFIVQDSSNEELKSILGATGNLNEHLAYESAISSFFFAKEVKENDFDHTFDYTDYTDKYIESDGENQEIENVFVYKFNAGESKQDIREITFSQRIYMGGAYYRLSVIDLPDNDSEEAETTNINESLVYFLPGQQSVSLDNPIEVKGEYAVKVEARIPDMETVSQNTGTYLSKYLNSNCYRDNMQEEELVKCLFDGVGNTNGEPVIPTNGYSYNNNEKKYDLVSVYTDDHFKTLTFHYKDQDGNDTTSSNDEYRYDDIIIAPEIPEQPKTAQFTYTFIGWNTKPDGTGQTLGEGDIVKKNSEYTYYAQYSKVTNEYTIKFVNHDGAELQSSNVPYGETPAYTGDTPVKAPQDGDEFVFTRWDPEVTSVTGDATYTAQFGIKGRAITYELNGGTNNSSNPDSYFRNETVTFGSPSRNGYEFSGWFINSDFSGNAILTTEGLNGDIILYARWTPKIYTITYNLNGGTNNSSNPNTYTIEEVVSFRTPEKTGYIFNGWFNNANLNGSKVTGIQRGSTGDVVLYAKWTKENSGQPNDEQDNQDDSENYGSPNGGENQNTSQNANAGTNAETNAGMGGGEKYTVNYVLDGGENNSKNPTTLKIGEQVVLENPTRSGYTFLGWYDNPNFSGKKVLKIQQGSNEVTLYAKWQKNPEKETEKKTEEKKTSEIKQNNIISNIPETSSSQGSKSANTGYPEENNTFIQGDTYLAVMMIGVVGFVIYIVKSRRKRSRAK